MYRMTMILPTLKLMKVTSLIVSSKKFFLLLRSTYTPNEIVFSTHTAPSMARYVTLLLIVAAAKTWCHRG